MLSKRSLHLKVDSIPVVKSNSSSSPCVSRKRVKAELLLKQSHERFERKSKLLEKRNTLARERELERENITEVQNQLQEVKRWLQFRQRKISQ